MNMLWQKQTAFSGQFSLELLRLIARTIDNEQYMEAVKKSLAVTDQNLRVNNPDQDFTKQIAFIQEYMETGVIKKFD